MFNFIRRHQRLMQLVLLVLIVPSFVLIGVSGYTSYNSGDEDLVEVGDQAVTSQEYDAALRNQISELQRSMGGGFDPAVLDTPEAKQQLLDSLVNRRMLIDIATKDRFSVSDSALRQAIAANPELQEDGVFSPSTYNRLLAQMGISSKDFEQSQRAQLALRRVVDPVIDSAVMPQPMVDALSQLLTTTREIQLNQLKAQDYLAEQSITDAEIQEWYDQHQQQLALDDYVNVDYLLLDEAAATQGVGEVSDEDLQAYYDQNKSRFISPARINLSHILLQAGKSDTEHQSAQQAAKELASQAQADPDHFAELAKANSQDKGSASAGGELGWITAGNWPKALENAVFSMKKGEVSGVIEGPDGYHVFKANDYQPEQGQSFEQVKNEIIDEVKQQLAAERFADMATQLTHLVYEQPESLQAAADALGLNIQTAQGVARDRVLAAEDLGLQAQDSKHADLLADPRVRRALYTKQSLEDKHNAGVIELSSDSIIAVRVNEFVPAHVPTLAQVKSKLHEQLLHEKALKAAQVAGEQLLQQLNQGNNEVVEFTTDSLALSRIDTQQLPKATVDKVMSVELEQLPAYVGIQDTNGYQLVKINAETVVDLDPEIAQLLQTQLQQLWRDAQEAAYLQALRQQLNVKQLPAAQNAMAAEVDM